MATDDKGDTHGMRAPRSIHALLIEHNPSDADRIEEMLSASGDYHFSLTHAKTLSEGLEAIGSGAFEVVFLDLNLPDNEGVEGVVRFMDQAPETPVVVLAGESDQQAALAVVRCGGQDYLEKDRLNSEMLKRVALYAIERKQTEIRLKHIESRFRNLIDQSADGVVIVEQSGKVIYMNAAAEAVLNRKRQEMIGKDFGLPVMSGKTTDIDFIIDGDRLRTAEIRVHEIHWEEEKAYMVLIRDVTQQKQSEERLQDFRKFESISILAGGISHDYNNLLSSILGNIELARLDIDAENNAHKHLKKALDAVTHAKALTKRFLLLSRAARINRRNGSIGAVIRDAVELASGQTSATIDVSITDDIWPVKFDHRLIQQAVMNVIENAIESLEETGTSIRVCAENISIAPEEETKLPVTSGRYVKLTVKDKGQGISESDLDRVFDPYFSTKERGSRKGMGLGLTTAYTIIKNHNGYISLDSEAGVGTTVSVFLPASENGLRV